jgi:hypothetical protein
MIFYKAIALKSAEHMSSPNVRKIVSNLKKYLDTEDNRVYNNTPELWKGDLVNIVRSLKTDEGEGNPPITSLLIADVANEMSCDSIGFFVAYCGQTFLRQHLNN